MQVFDVSASLSGIELFPDSEIKEILQNVRTIITTLKGTVPLDRAFGIDPDLIDKPINIIKPLLVKEIKENIERYEPRAKLVSVNWSGEGSQGVLVPSIKVAIK